MAVPASGDASVLAPEGNAEAELLNRLDRGEPPSPLQLSGATATLGETYYAANGRRCRSVSLSNTDGSLHTRLVCSDAHQWFYVPEVVLGARAEVAP